MATSYATPGVYVEEIAKFPPSVAEVETAIPAFVGYTAIAANGNNVPVRITSLLEYEKYFGAGPVISVEKKDKPLKNAEFVLYDSVRLFYDNGGGACYVVAVGQYNSNLSSKVFIDGLEVLKKHDEVTLLLFPDAAGLDAKELALVQQAALLQCSALGDRFAILDVKKGNKSLQDDIKTFRDNIGTEYLKYGAAYYPYLSTAYAKPFTFEDIMQYTDGFKDDLKLMDASSKEVLEGIIKRYRPQEKTKPDTKEQQETSEPKEQKSQSGSSSLKPPTDLEIKSIIPFIPGYSDQLAGLNAVATMIPPSGAVAGIIATSDRNKGVWQAPANMSIACVNGVSDFIADPDQENMNIDPTGGKSVNAIRAFSGKGILVWGARTLDGNDNEWRYIPVRRLFNFVEESARKSTSWAVFQPNDANTWVRIKAQLENFLNNMWRRGALAGARPEDAYYVSVGIPATMSGKDVLDGSMMIEIGMAAVRPAEFIILRFSHKLQVS